MKSNIHQYQYKITTNMTKKILLVSLLSVLFIFCGGKEDNQSIEGLINTKNVEGLQKKKTALQADIAKIEEALSTLDVKTEEALVAIATVKDTVFSHYLEIQGSIDTKENILVQPEFSGTLTSLTVKAGDKVGKGQILGRIDDGGMSQQLASLENQYELAKTTFERQKKPLG